MPIKFNIVDLSIIIKFFTKNNFIYNINITINSTNEKLLNYLKYINNHEYFDIDFFEDFSFIPENIKTFLSYFNNYYFNLSHKELNSITLYPPYDQLFLEKLLFDFNNKIYINDKEIKLKFIHNYYSLNIDFDLMNNKIKLNDDSCFLLQTTSCNFIIHNNVIQPLYSIFKPEIYIKLFQEKTISIDNDIKLKFLKNYQKNPILTKSFKLPEIKEYKDLDIVIYIELNKEKFILSCFLEKENIKIPLDINDTRKSSIFQEDLIFNHDNSVVIVPSNSKSYENIIKFIQITNKYFYSLLNEIVANKIETNDADTIFQKYLIQLKDIAILKYNNSDLKIINSKFNNKTIELKKIENNNDDKDYFLPKIDWFEVNFYFEIENIKLTIREVHKLINNGYIIRDNVLLTIDPDEQNNIKKILKQIYYEKENNYYINKYQLPFIIKEELNLKLPEELKNIQKAIQLATLSKNKLHVKEVPEILKNILRNYQKIGFQWLHFLNTYGFGGILADEMGLGKTLQIISFLLTVKDKGTSIIICPTSLIYNWVAEIKKFVGDSIKYIVIDGNKDERKNKIKTINNYEVAITSYNMAYLDEDLYKDITFYYCILDEAHHIKNKKAKRTISIKGIKARNRIALTGTPIENNISELWSLFDFIMPEFLGNFNWFRDNILASLYSNDKEEREETMDNFKKIIKPFILRRTKSSVLKELPDKIEQEIILELTEKQKAIYLDILSSVKNNLFKLIQEKGIENSYIHFLSALTRLRQICLHPGLINKEFEDMPDSSIKIKALIELLLESIDSGHRIIVFSQFVKMLNIIKKELIKYDIEYFYLDGKTKNRIELVEEFNKNDVPVFLISLKAGGHGINLIGADSAILFDPWWNPAIENQAIDRIHRIGQINKVHIYRLITEGTIEEKIRKLQSYKQEIFNNLIVNNENFIKNLKFSDIQYLFDYQ